MSDNFNAKIVKDLSFEEFISHITKKTKKVQPHSDDYRLVKNAEKHLALLGSAYQQLSKRIKNKKKITSSGVEWFLDNFYVIQEAVNLIQEDLPKGYFTKLPSLEQESGKPRTYVLARAFTTYFEIEVVMNDLHNFLNHYQEEVTLKMSELWALPLMLRLVMIEYLATNVSKVIDDDIQGEVSADIALQEPNPDEIIARAVRTLHTLNRVDWKDFFEAHAKVEYVLREDPSGHYAQMDFKTRDQYRKEIENFAQDSQYTEVEVAETAIYLAKNNAANTQKTNHVGYFLVDKGQAVLREKINYLSSVSEKLQTFFFDNRTAFYLGGIGLITLTVLAILLFIAAQFDLRAWQLILIGLISAIPASSVAVQLVNSILTATLPPRVLPKMDFSKKIPRKYRTMVAIPAMLTNEEEIDFLLSQLELHFLANKDPNIGFILLLDYSDAPQEIMPEDENLRQYAIDGIKKLNKRYQGDNGQKPFFLYHRCRQWNPKEDMWMGWERKRGKLLDFNRYLMEGFDRCIDTIIGDLDFLYKVKFVITVDADTVMPRDSANALIATLAHPLNKAEFEEGTSKVKSGYTILQPRTEVKPTSVNQSFFTQVFAGDMGLDLYTRAVSNVYQDLFGEGIFTGKGIYDVEALLRSLENKVPNNTLLSHDLFEGLQGRTALVSDIVFLEDYPPTYASQVKRRHRWVRGDWQLLPWLFSKVPLKDGNKGANPFSIIDKWKIFDNLRRSLLSPFLLLSFLAGWLVISKGSWLWTLIVLFISAFPLINHFVTSLSTRLMTGAKPRLFSDLKVTFLRWLFHIIFLVYDALIIIDAVLSTLIRIFISHKRLLQWQTSAHTIEVFGKQRKISTTWKRMIWAPILSIIIGLFVFIINPSALWASSPLLLIWAFSPQVAYWISLEVEKESQVQLSDQEMDKLHEIARKTWLYFEHFIGPDDHWLPPDHFQEDPKGVVAHRTSPTNIGLMFLSTITAYELGYINILDFIYRMDYSFSTIDGLEKYRGHLLNWYDTQNLSSLSPRYVSTVDSGNFAICLVGLYQNLSSLEHESLSLKPLLCGMVDSLRIFQKTVTQIDFEDLEGLLSDLDNHCNAIIEMINADEQKGHHQIVTFKEIEARFSGPMNKTLLKVLESEKLIDPPIIKDLHYWWNAIYQQIRNIRRQIEMLTPWLVTWHDRPAFTDDWIREKLGDKLTLWIEEEPLQTTLVDMPGLCEKTIKKLLALDPEQFTSSKKELTEEERKTLQEWLKTFGEDLSTSKKNIEEHNALIANLKDKTDFYLERLEFDFLFDHQREVFHLGYQVGSGQLDDNHYDLFASEARTASLFAIAQNNVPRSHWLHMSRPFTTIDGIPTLVSWNGSMFEYLMPNLFNHTYPGTLLHDTNKGVVQAQIAYGNQNSIPWGISESSYYRFDQSENYQYRSFGVPGLGRKRGLADDLVIAPYASLMAISIDPKAVLKNIEALADEGAWGHFGFYESIDYTASRLPVGTNKAIIKSYMAHHQGMVLVAMGNYLNAKSIISQIHRDPRIKSVELLLQEQIPQTEEKFVTGDAKIMAHSEKMDRIIITPWTVDLNQPGKQAHVISNGRLRMLITNTGSGYLAWKDIALTRWRQDEALDPFGIWFYVYDYDHEKVWSLGREPIMGEPQEYRVIFSPHKAEIRRVEDDIRMIMQTTITPQDDVCIHKISLSNQSDHPRDLRLISYGEVVLAPQATDRQHPAFNKLFIESEFDEETNMLFFQRRRRSDEEEPCGMAHVMINSLSSHVQYESDREQFLGRGHDIHNPIVLSNQKMLSGTTGVTLDPIFSLGKSLSIEPHQTITLNYLTIAAETIEKAKRITEKYQGQAIIDTAFDSSQSASERQLRSLDLDSDLLSTYQELLSRVIYPASELRPPSTVLENNVLGQSGLWRFGISGDYPMLLATINHQDGLDNLQEIIQAHKYWRKLGLMIDLVILNTKDTGYTYELNERIHRLLNLLESQSWVNQRGGIFILTSGQMQKEALTLLKSFARVVIDVNANSLAGHLNKTKHPEASLPDFSAVRPKDEFVSTMQVKRPEGLVFDNRLGGFTPDGKEYQIFLQDYPKLSKEPGKVTPAPWINVIANEKFGCLVTESGGGYTWFENSGENRLTPWTNDPVSDPPGEVLYLRDEMTGNIWSATPAPAGQGRDYLVRHGQGYSIFESTNQGFKQSLKIFVDPNEPIKFFALTLKNETDKNRRLTTTLFAEWVLQSNREISKSMIIPAYDHESGTLLAENPYNEEFASNVAFLTSDHPVHGLTTNRREFFGLKGHRQSPEALQRIGLSETIEPSVDACAALQNHLNFNPHQELTIIYGLGQAPNMEEAKNLAKIVNNRNKLRQSWDNNQAKWDDLLGAIQVETPSKEMNLILNRWLLYQALSCRIWGRSAFYQSSGAYGFRDQLQDVLSVLPSNPEISREHILRSARHQFETGDVLHWWHPPSGRGVRTKISDDLLWMVYATYEYVNKTGDSEILHEAIPFITGEPLGEDEHEHYDHFETSDESASLFEHCKRALEFADTEGPHGLPLIGSGDWNDGMNRVGIEGQGESVWLGWFLVENHRRFAQLCKILELDVLADQHLMRADDLQETINRVAWDGNWYLRAYYDDGTPLGSHHNQECQIDSLPQSWAVLTRSAPKTRQEQAIKAVKENLVQEQDQLIKLFTPPFDETEKNPGYIKGYPPGIRENGGQYTHAAIWAVWALTHLGQGDEAFKQFSYLNPINHTKDISSVNQYAVEPYVVAADVYSKKPFIGHGGWTWYTGSSGWLYRLGIEAILGFTLMGDHFTMDPCIPSDWEGFKFIYKKDGSIYIIKVENPDHIQKGVNQIIMDGEELPDKRIFFQDDNKEHHIRVSLG